MIKKILKISFLYFFLSLLPISAKAFCRESSMSSLKELASNINVSYSYKIQDDYALFDVTLDNVFGEVYVLDENQNRYDYNKYNKGVLVFTNLSQGKNYAFQIYANGGECGDAYLTTVYATTPTYNRYYNSNICSNAKEYELCGRWVSHNLNYHDFVNKVKEYVEKKDNDKTIEDNKSIPTISYVLNFIEMYYVYIIITIVIVILLIKYIKYKRDTFGF